MAFVDAEEPDPDRTELRRRGTRNAPRETETQYVGVEVEQARWRSSRRHHDVAQALIARDEPGAERGDHRAVVEHRAVEDLRRGAGRIVERDHLFDAAGVGLLDCDSSLNGDAGAVQRGLDPFQRGVVAHLPADGEHLVGVAGHHDDARGALVHPQVQRGLVGPGALGEAQHVEGELSPRGRCRWSEP